MIVLDIPMRGHDFISILPAATIGKASDHPERRTIQAMQAFCLMC
jgi:hypothetical protein